MVFDPKDLTVGEVGERLAAMPDLTIGELGALLEAEGAGSRPRVGVERLLDARLAALAAAAMVEEVEVEAEPAPSLEELEAELEEFTPSTTRSFVGDGAVTSNVTISRSDIESELVKGIEVHVHMEDGTVHEGYFVAWADGAMVRMRDGTDTVRFVPGAMLHATAKHET